MTDRRVGFMWKRGLASCLSLILAAPSGAAPVPGERQVRVKAALANLRQAPTADAPVVAQAKAGDLLRVIEVSGDWYVVETSGGKRGYVFATLVEPVRPAPVAAAPPLPPAAPTLALAPTAGVAIDHDGVGCALAEQHPKLNACFTPDSNVGKAQVHFRALETDPWFAVDLSPDGPCYSTILPKPDRATRQFQYYVDVIDRGFTETWKPDSAPQGAYRVKVVQRVSDCQGTALKMANAMLQAARPVVVSIVKDAAGRALDQAAARLLESRMLLNGFRPDGVVVSSTGAPPSSTTTANRSSSAGSGGGGSHGGAVAGILVGGLVAVAGGIYAASKASSAAPSGPPSSTAPGAPSSVTGPPPWNYSLKCVQDPTIVASATILLNETSGGGRFSGSTTGIDLDGKSLLIQISGSYSSSSGSLTGQINSICDGCIPRVDNFSTTLSSTDTGFISLSCTQGCSCPGQMRLVRQGS